MKKIFVIVISILMTLLLAVGCTSAPAAPVGTATSSATEAEAAPAATKAAAPAEKDEYVIAGTLQDMSNEFMVMLKDAMDAAMVDMPDAKLQILDGEGSPEKQIAQIENFIAQGVDAIVLCPQDGTALVPVVKQAVEAGIPVITCSADVDQDVGQVLVGSNHKEAGIMEAEYVAEQLGGKGNVVYMRGPIGHFAEVQRAEGTLEVFEKYPDIKIVFDQTGNWDRDQGMSLMENWLQSGTTIDCVMAQNDEMVLGAITAIEGAKKEGTILTCGIDAIPDAVIAVKDGRLDATIFQDAVGQGAGALKTAYAAAKGEKVEPLVIPWMLVTEKNAEEYIVN
ncbi:MAG: sugar ABC transporter substrate-binding protein [Christensenellaceae bacterium]